MALRITVLGPVVAWQDERPVDLGPHKQKSVLAVLAAHLGDEVSTDRIIEAVWGDAASASAKRSVQTYVSNLRGLLGASDRDALRGSKTGYTLDRHVVTTDWLEFEGCLAGETAETLRNALDLWRGEPFQDVERDWARPLIAAWTEQRLGTIERWAELLAGAGRPAEAIPVLERLVTEHPTRESLWAALMRSLAAAGRAADALAAYQRLRHSLSDTLGVNPSPTLQNLEEEILLAGDARRVSPARVVGTPLPVTHTRLVGRFDQVDQVRALLDRHRLVTLLGPGGSGKTRLAIEAATGYADSVSVHFVDLARLNDESQVPQAVATALGVAIRGKAAPEEEPLVQLARAVERRTMLVVLDNCEHVIEATAESATTLLGASSDVRVLATSREPLGISGETRHQVPPLPIDADGNHPALELMLDRAADATGDASFTGDDRQVLAEVAKALDGMPLAIELAAAQLAYLSPTELQASLAEQLTMSAGRGTENRHETLQATMEWSWRLLDEHEQVLLTELSVFSGGWTMEAAGGICTGTEEQIRRTLGSLAAKSLVQAARTVWGTRYRLLETVRLFATERLGDRTAVTRQAHADWFAGWCASFSLTDHYGSGALASQLAHDHENLRAALFHHAAGGDMTAANHIVAAHAYSWRGNHSGKEALEWSSMVDPDQLELTPRCQWFLSRAAALQVNDDWPGMWALADTAEALAEETGNLQLIAVALASGAFGYLLQDADIHTVKWTDVIDAAHRAGANGIAATGYAMRALGVLMSGGDQHGAEELLTQAEEPELPPGWNRSIVAMASLHVRLGRGDNSGALEAATVAARGWDSLGLPLDDARSTLGLAYAAARNGVRDVFQASVVGTEAQFSASLPGRVDGDVLLILAAWEAFQGDPLRAAELLASVRHGGMEFPETFVKYWEVRNRLVELDLPEDAVSDARRRGAESAVTDVLRREFARLGWS